MQCRIRVWLLVSWWLLSLSWSSFGYSREPAGIDLGNRVKVTVTQSKQERKTGLYAIKLTLAPKPKQTLYGPLSLVVTETTPPGKTLINATDQTATGRPYLVVQLPANGLRGGKKAKPKLVAVRLLFANPDGKPLKNLKKFQYKVFGLLEPNHPPQADAGTDRTATVGETVTLDGSRSSDGDGHVLTYAWNVTDRPVDGSDILSYNGAQAEFTAHKPGVYRVGLVVNDGIADSAQATATITVTPKTTPNSPPTANAGANQTTTVGRSVTLDGSASTDPDGGPGALAFTWTQVSGPTATLSDPHTAQPSFTPTTAGTYTFNLVVEDGQDASAPGSTSVTVAEAVLDTEPPGPAKLVGASSLSGDQITAEWLPAIDNQTSQADLVYTLHIAKEAGFTPSTTTARLTQTAALSGTLDGLTPDTRYYIKVVATDGRGQESWSNELATTTAAVTAQTTSATVDVQDKAQAPVATGDSITYSADQAPTVGQYLASPENGGYLRKVVGVARENGRITATTAPAALNEIFETLDLNATIKLEPVPADTSNNLAAAAALVGSGVKKTATPPNRVRSWTETGLTLIDHNANPAPIRSGPAFRAAQNVDVDGDQQTTKGEYLDFTGPSYVAATPGQSKQFKLNAMVARQKYTLLGNPVPLQICEIRLVEFSHKDSAKNDTIASNGLHLSTLDLGGQMATLNVSWTPSPNQVHDGGLPYYATFEVVLDEQEDGCSQTLLNGWEETLTLKIPIYVTMGELPNRGEEKTLNFSGGFSVTDTATFTASPEFQIAARIQSARLQTATLAVKADIEFEQELAIHAQGESALNAEQYLLAPRKFIKVFVAGGVPVVVSGEFAIKAYIHGQAHGVVDLNETFRYAFPNARFGLRYDNGAWSEIREFQPEYKFTLKGEGKAGVELTLTLEPDLTLHFYDAASGRMLLNPYLYANAGIYGQFKYEDDNGNYLEDPPDYWFTNLEAGGGMNLRLYAGLHIFDYNIVSYPENATVDQAGLFKCLTVIGKSRLGEPCQAGNGIPIAGIPSLDAKAEPTIQPESFGNDFVSTRDSRSVLIQGTYQNVANPFKPIFGGPDALITFQKWTEPKVITHQEGSSIVPATDGSDGRYWLHYSQPGQYEIRLGAYSDLGWFVRQIAPVTVDLTDKDHDGMVDQWETLWNVDDPNADPDKDGIANIKEFQTGNMPTVVFGQSGSQTCPIDPSALTTPTSRFNFNNNGTVTDKQTGLMWKQSVEHLFEQHYNNNEIIEYTSYRLFFWQGAMDYVQNLNKNGGFAGYTDWRLPGINELFSIVEGACYPAVNQDVFDYQYMSDNTFWSSSSINGNSVWVVDFFAGGYGGNLKSGYGMVRLVRGPQYQGGIGPHPDPPDTWLDKGISHP